MNIQFHMPRFVKLSPAAAGCRHLAAVAWLALASTAIPAEHPSLAQARKALGEGIPQVAIYTLQGAMAAPGFPPADRAAARRLLAEAQLTKGDSAAALETLSVFSDASDANAMLLRAHAYAAEGRWENALALYETLRGTPGVSLQAAVGEAESLQAQGRTAEAVSVLGSVVTRDAAVPARLRYCSLLIEVGRIHDARTTLAEIKTSGPGDENWKRYLMARIFLLEGNSRAALAILEPMLKAPSGERPTGMSAPLYAAATIALGEANYAPGAPEAAIKILESFIRENAESAQVDVVFRRLDQLYAEDKTPREGVMQSFVAEASPMPPNVKALARYYLTLMQLRGGRFDRAKLSVTQFLAKFPQHPLVPLMHGLRAKAELADESERDRKAALAAAEAALDEAALAATSEEMKAEFALRTALVNLEQREFLRAASHLKTAKESPRLRMSAEFNSALAWLMQGNHQLFEKEYGEFVANSASPVAAGSLRLEQGLVKARTKEADAAKALAGFLRDFPAHPRKVEAQLALAELAFQQGNQLDALMYVQTVNQVQQPPEIAGQADYLGIFIEDAKQPRDEERVIALARAFISKFPTSPRLAEVRMKLGQVYFQREDYLNASEQFETLALAEPNGPYAETALFLAAQCGTKLFNEEAHKRSLVLFDQVAERHGKLEFHARLQQAILKSQLGAEDDAVKIYDSILASTPPTEVRYAAIVGKGDNLAALARKDAKYGAPAIAAYEQMLAIPEAAPAWRNQAAFKKAKTLQQLGRNDEALVVLNGILDSNAGGTRETFWLSRAGFEAAGLLEGQQQWRSAIGIYQKMAKIPGPHVHQAKLRVKALQSEHFIWD